MPKLVHSSFTWLALTFAVLGCGGVSQKEPLLPVETFSWCPQPISFAPPPKRWYRQGDNGGGTLGVRFILSHGGGQCISLAGYSSFAERNPKQAIARLIGRRDSLGEREFLREVSKLRARTDDPLSHREAMVAASINDALDRVSADHFAGQPGFVLADLESALRVASSYEMTLEEILPRIRLHPERMREPERWRLGYQRDTVIAGHPAFAADDTLITDERPLLYHQIFWVVDGYAFNAIYQGTPENLATFHRVLDSVAFPEPAGASPR
ncbi:MAG TPA: hypothetical protein VFQ05_14890 [Candidatus Eisenbacteria bacterium]|nr:hypothetical protein [Candidatus Eisenbacteria bacterium]